MSDVNPAYLIASSFMPANHGSLTPYFEAVHSLIEKAGAEIVIAGESGQLMHHFEGDWPQDATMTVFRFPSMEALLGFWNSPEYQAAKHLRTDVIKPQFTFAVEGFTDDTYENKL